MKTRQRKTQTYIGIRIYSNQSVNRSTIQALNHQKINSTIHLTHNQSINQSLPVELAPRSAGRGARSRRSRGQPRAADPQLRAGQVRQVDPAVAGQPHS